MNHWTFRQGVVLIVMVLATPVWGAETSTEVSGGGSGPFVQLEGHGSILSDIPQEATLAISFGYGLRGGYRWSGWGAFLQVEQNMWLSTELKKDVVDGVLNIGIGGEFLYADGFVRTSLAVGPSILLWNTVLDSAGTVGFFLDLRPVGLRWPVHEHLVLGLDPIAFALVAPVLSGIPLFKVEYRTVFAIEAVF